MDLFSASTYLLLVCKYKQSWDFKLSTFHLENFFLPPPPLFLFVMRLLLRLLIVVVSIFNVCLLLHLKLKEAESY